MQFVTLNTIINDLLLIIRGSNISRSEPISRRQVEDWVHQYRAVLLKRDIDKGKIPNPDFIQEIPMLEMEVDTVDTGLIRTVLDLPKTINFNFKSGFTFIGLPDGTEIQYVAEGRNKWQQYKKYTPNDPIVFLRNSKLYVRPGSDSIPYLSIRGIFEVPSEAARFINPHTSLPYFNLDSKYPIPNDMVPILKEMILSKELNIEVKSPTDKKNDTSHGLSENVEK